jgi:hypothetical protein
VRGCKILLSLLLATLLSGCWSMHLDNGSDHSQRHSEWDPHSEWHHDGIFRLVEFSKPVNLHDRCSGKEWKSVYIRKSFLNVLADVAVALLAPLYDGWTVDVTCEQAVRLRIPLTSNVPSSRLGSSYASPGGEYTVKVPHLVKPGAIIREGTDPPNQVVVFLDDFGTLYRILSRDNQTGEVTFEQLESGLRVGESPFGPIREQEVVTTIRGQELRLSTLMKEGSPLVFGGRALSLVAAVSIFIHGDRVYTVSAGVTPEGWNLTEAEASARAKENLETFLAGLSLN